MTRPELSPPARKKANKRPTKEGGQKRNSVGVHAGNLAEKGQGEKGWSGNMAENKHKQIKATTSG